MTAPQTNEIRNGVRFRNAALCAAFGALSAMSFIVSGENYQGISDPPASSASYLWCALALCFALLYHTVYGRRKLRPAPANGVFALIFGVVNAFGVWLYSYDSWAALKNPLTLGLVCLQAVGQSLPMLAGFTWLHGGMQKTFAALPGAGEHGGAAGVLVSLSDRLFPRFRLLGLGRNGGAVLRPAADQYLAPGVPDGAVRGASELRTAVFQR